MSKGPAIDVKSLESLYTESPKDNTVPKKMKQRGADSVKAFTLRDAGENCDKCQTTKARIEKVAKPRHLNALTIDVEINDLDCTKETAESKPKAGKLTRADLCDL